MAQRLQGQVTQPSGPHFEFWLEGSHPDEVRHLEPGDGGRSERHGGRDPEPGRSSPARRRMVATGLAVACVVAVAVPLAVVLSPTSSRPIAHQPISGPARHVVLAALSNTMSSGSFDFSYTDNQVASSASNSGSQGSPLGLSLSGQGTMDTDPFVMEVTSNVPGTGDVTTWADSSDVWEQPGGSQGMAAAPPSEDPGTPLAGFASLVEGTLGPRQGPLGMMELASPTGYLELDQNAITSVTQSGQGSVDGTPVVVYQVELQPAEQTDPPGASAAEDAAINNALASLAQQGYRGTSVQISIDSAGFIRQTVSTASFSDGATQTGYLTLSNFGCAGTVLVPGQSGSPAPAQHCPSPGS